MIYLASTQFALMPILGEARGRAMVVASKAMNPDDNRDMRSNLPPIVIGNITFEDWESKILSEKEQVMEDANWYAKIFGHFDVMAQGDKKMQETLTKAWLSGQQNETPASALANVIYIHEQFKRGVPFDEVWTGEGKPLAIFYVDDSAIEFNGDWEDALWKIQHRKLP